MGHQALTRMAPSSHSRVWTFWSQSRWNSQKLCPEKGTSRPSSLWTTSGWIRHGSHSAEMKIGQNAAEMVQEFEIFRFCWWKTLPIEGFAASGKYLVTTHMILKESPSKSPDAGEDKVDLIKFSGGVSRSVVLRQQAVQQGAQCLIEQNIELLLLWTTESPAK